MEIKLLINSVVFMKKNNNKKYLKMNELDRKI